MLCLLVEEEFILSGSAIAGLFFSMVEFAVVSPPPPPEIYIRLFKYPVIGYNCQTQAATEVSDIVI